MLHGSTWTAACKLVLRDQSYKHATWRPKHLQASERFYCAKPWYFFLLLLFFLPPLTGELPHVAKLTCSSFCSFSLITTGIDTGNKSRSGIPADPTGSPSPIPYLDILGVDIFSECQLPKHQLPKCQLPKMSTPKMPTPKMSTLKNLNFKWVVSLQWAS